MLKIRFELIKKTLLTHDVYELIYACKDIEKEIPKAGQYVMFQLAPGLNRAYSLASFTHDTFTLIIKRIPNGKGSPIICDAKVGDVFDGLFPLGHFTIQENTSSKCFIGTGTGFAPLYCQMIETQKFDTLPTKIAFIFGVRNFQDSFYEEAIDGFGKNIEDFTYIPYFSREEIQDNKKHQRKGYVTDWLTEDNISHYEEFYLCGSPVMVKDAREKLSELGVEKERVFWEQF